MCLRLYVLFNLFRDTIQLFDSYRILKEKEELLSVWLYHVQLYVGLVLTVSIIWAKQVIHFRNHTKKEMSEFNSLILLCQNSLLVFSWTHQLVLFWFVCVFRISKFLFSAFRLGPFGTNLYLLIWWVWCLLYEQFWIRDLSLSVFIDCFSHI